MFGPHRRALASNKGFTLVELMIVVAIIGILASVGIVAFNRQVTATKVGKMKQVAIDLGRGMESFRSRHGRYYPLTPTPEVYAPTLEKKWANLLEFKPGAGAANMTITICAGDKGGAAAAPCNLAAPPTAEKRWFAVVVEMDMNGDSGDKTTVAYSNNGADPVETNVGE